MSRINTTNQMVAEFARVLDQPAPLEPYNSYCETIAKVYGAQFCPMRECWDAMCSQPRRVRKLTDAEFDDNQESIANGGGEIYS